MASSGPNSPSTVTDNSSIGTLAWSNPGNAVSSNNSYADATIFGAGAFTHYLKSVGYGFSIPSGATIDGIVVEAEIKATNNAFEYVVDYDIKMQKAGSNAGTNKGRGTGVKWPASDTYVTWGSSTDLWGTTWSDTDINDANFGVSIAAQLIDLAKAGNNAYVDHIRITVYYTAGGGGSSQSALLTVSD